MARPRMPLARHARLRSPHPFGRVLALVATAALVLVMSAAGVAGFRLWDAADGIRENAVDIGGDEAELPPQIGAIEGGVNLLLVGTDSCENQDVTIFARCGIDDDGGERNDVTMLVHIADDPRRVTVVSFPRDLYVSIPECTDDGGDATGGTYEKINASYQYGGLACTAATVRELTGEDVHFAAAIRWTGVINLSDAVGGVDVCVAGDISDSHTGLDLAAGTHTLQGVQALQFLRVRHGIGDGSDLGRISNQQQFMSSLVRKLRSGDVLGNPATLLGLADTALDQVSRGQLVLDTRLANLTRMVQIAMALNDVPYRDIVFVQYPNAGSGDGVVPVEDAADALFAALRENKSLELTGEASPVGGVEVTGEVADPAATAAPERTPGGDATVPADAATLPPEVTGSNASQVTCTQPEF